jgi:hypothetical protein
VIAKAQDDGAVLDADVGRRGACDGDCEGGAEIFEVAELAAREPRE